MSSIQEKKERLAKLDATRAQIADFLKWKFQNSSFKGVWFYLMLTPAVAGVSHYLREGGKEGLAIALWIGIGYVAIPFWREAAYWKKAYTEHLWQVENFVSQLPPLERMTVNSKLQEAKQESDGKLLRVVCEDAANAMFNARNNLIKELTAQHEEGRIAPTWWRQLKDDGLEYQVKRLFQDLGFHASTTPSTGDGGIDVVVDFGNDATLLVQCKGWAGKVSVATVRELAGVVSHRRRASSNHAYIGCIVAANGLTAPAEGFAKANRLIALDEYNLAELARRTSKRQAIDYLESISPR